MIDANTGRRGQPFRVARPHFHLTVGAERDRIVPGVSTNVGAEEPFRVWAENFDFVLRDFPPGVGNVQLLLRETFQSDSYSLDIEGK